MIETYRGCVSASQCDEMGHMNTQFYVALFHAATALLFHAHGASPGADQQLGLGWADVVHQIQYRRELRAGAVVAVRSAVTSVGGKSVGYRHRLLDLETGEEAAVLEGKAVRFDRRRRASAVLEPGLQASLQAALAG
jgi:acyl-CoA thioester hydrolase